MNEKAYTEMKEKVISMSKIDLCNLLEIVIEELNFRNGNRQIQDDKRI